MAVASSGGEEAIPALVDKVMVSNLNLALIQDILNQWTDIHEGGGQLGETGAFKDGEATDSFNERPRNKGGGLTLKS